jgi:hypothetical protein
LASPADLPPGLSTFLRVARVSEGESGAVQLSLPSGPGHERLSEPAILGQLRVALGRHLDGAPEIILQPPDQEETGTAERISQESVRNGRLKDLVKKEPILGRAVEELDLELLD